MATAAQALSQTASSCRFEIETSERDNGLSAFANMRPRLFGIACHMLGSSVEAEDIVQDVWLRWHFTNRSQVENPPAFLATTTRRLCINLVQSAHSRREIHFGPQLPEPVSPTERAAYVLREAFDYSYHQIAYILQMEEANTRQLVSRARKHIADGRRTPASSGEQRRFMEAFINAAQKGDMGGLEGLFAEGIVSCEWQTIGVVVQKLPRVFDRRLVPQTIWFRNAKITSEES